MWTSSNCVECVRDDPSYTSLEVSRPIIIIFFFYVWFNVSVEPLQCVNIKLSYLRNVQTKMYNYMSHPLSEISLQMNLIIKTGSLDLHFKTFHWSSHHGLWAIIPCPSNMVSMRVISWGDFRFSLVCIMSILGAFLIK